MQIGSRRAAARRALIIIYIAPDVRLHIRTKKSVAADIWIGGKFGERAVPDILVNIHNRAVLCFFMHINCVRPEQP